MDAEAPMKRRRFLKDVALAAAAPFATRGNDLILVDRFR
jgi:hypothetical protein